MPTPHPATTCVIKLSGSLIGATGAACTEVVMKASAAKEINLIIRASPLSSRRDFLDTWIVVDPAQQSLTQIKMALAGPNAFLAQ
jgi:hypothetical protein